MNEHSRFHQSGQEWDRADQAVAALATVEPPDDAAVLRARQDLHRHVGTARTSGHGAGTAVARFRRQVPRPLLVAAVVAATVAVVTAVPLTLSRDTTSRTPAGQVQEQPQQQEPEWVGPTPDPNQPEFTSSKVAYDWLASKMANSKYPDWQDAKYWYVRSLGADGLREVWIGHSSAGRVIDGDQPPVDQPVAQFGLEHTDTKFVDWDGLWSLPTDPATLEQKLRSGFDQPEGAKADSELWTVTNDLLVNSPAPPLLRAAMFRMLGTLPGVTVRQIDKPRTLSSIAITRDDDGFVTSYTYDIYTGGLLESKIGDNLTTYQLMGWTNSPKGRPVNHVLTTTGTAGVAPFERTS